MAALPSPWLVQVREPSARLRLLCLPSAGGGASAFRGWSEELPASVEVCAWQPPGREARIHEPVIASLPQLVETLADEIRAERDRPFALFGHSIGALVAFELTRALRRRGERLPVHLFVSGCGAPQLGDPEVLLAGLPDAELIERLRRLDGTSDAVLAHAELMALVLPALRADLGLRDGYACADEEPLEIGITAFGGLDDPEVSAAGVAAWRAQTRGRFVSHGFDGGHFFLHTARAPFLRVLRAVLSQLVDAEAVAGARDHHVQ